MYEIADKVWHTLVDMSPSDNYPNYGKHYGEISYSYGHNGVRTVVYHGWYDSVAEANEDLRKTKEMFAVN